MTTTAAEKVAGISDVLEEILIRLPAKSLARSMLVSKQWLSEISNPQFLQHHFGHRPNKLPTGMFLTDSKSICSDANFVSLNDLNPTHQTIPSLGFLYDGIKQLVGDGFSEIKLLKSCNGLLLGRVVTLKDLKPRFHHKYCVCNPTTKKFRLLPETPFRGSSFQYNSSIVLAFDPSLSLHYKVICTQDFAEIFIYSSENQCWSPYASPFDHRQGWFFLNGSMYSTPRSLRFDVYTETMEQIKMPPRVGYAYDLPVIGSHVYRAVRKDPLTTDDIQLVEMSSDFSEWVPKYNVSVTPLLSAFPEINKTSRIYRFKAICVVDGVKEDGSDVVLGITGKLILYNLKKKTAKELCKLHDEPDGTTGYNNAQANIALHSRGLEPTHRLLPYLIFTAHSGMPVTSPASPPSKLGRITWKMISKYDDVSLTPLLSAFPEAICVVEGVKEDESYLVLGIPDKLISYNLKEKSAKELCALDGELSDITSYRKVRVYQFIECLSDV